MQLVSGCALVMACASCALCAVGRADDGDAPAAEWWERGQDTWYYKDDWKALYLTRCRTCSKTIEIPEPVRAAYAYVWASRGYSLKVNGEQIGADSDDGTIEDYDLSGHLVPGDNTLAIEAGGEVICEGAVVLQSGREIHFATDASWGQPGTQTSEVRKSGPRGYSGDTHMARRLEVTAEQKAKALVNRLNSVRRRLLDCDRYVFWRHRDPREVLTLGRATPERQTWGRIERLLEAGQEPLARASQLVRDGDLADVQSALAPAIKSTESAEELYQDLLARLQRGESGRRQALTGSRAARDADLATFNGSRRNRLGWVTSNEPLDNDPAYWEFDVLPPGATSIGLAGLWRFALDPEDRGVAESFAASDFDDSAWDLIFAPTKWGWERWGYTREYQARRGLNKPYNGIAWYRKRLVVPAAWQGKDLILRLGPRWNNVDWLSVNGRFLDDPGEAGSNAGAYSIPASHIRFGAVNALALRVLNENNIGGLINPGLRLSVADAQPSQRRSVCGPGTVRETVFDTPEGQVTQVAYCSALSPAVVLATSGQRLRLAGWAARGYDAPDRCAFTSAGKLEVRQLGSTRTGEVADGRALDENWLLLWNTQSRAISPRPLLVVLERRPTSIELLDDGFGGPSLDLRFARGGARMVLVRPFDGPLGQEPGAEDIQRCRLWSRALLRYPVGYLEQLAFDGARCNVRIAYEYLQLKDDWQTEPLALAPLPMLFSYALEHNWPNATVHTDVTDLGCRSQSKFYPESDCGTYRAAVDHSEVAYSFDRMEPPVHYKGIGSLGEERRIGEPMFIRVKEWGCNCFRPQIPFHNVGFFQHEGRGLGDASTVQFSQEALGWLDDMLETHRRLGLMCFLNWFGLEGQRFSQATRRQVRDFWVQMAQHCRELPPELVCYDLMNEPAGLYGGAPLTRNAWDEYSRLVREVTEAIREVDRTHPISVEAGGGWAQPEDLDMTEPTGDANTIYQFHYYGPHTGDCHRWDLWYPRYQPDEQRFHSYEAWEERMLSPIRFQIRSHAQLMHGEFGISFLGPDDAPRLWLDDVLAIHEKYRIHWVWWNYSGNDIHRTGLMSGDRINPLVSTLRKYAAAQPE